MPRTRTLAVAITILALSGLLQRLWTERGLGAPALEAAVARMNQLPLTVGSWRGQELALDPRETAGAGYAGSLWRRYEDLESGQVVSVLLVCGRPSRVAVHTPDACYPSAGYEMQGQPARFPLTDPSRPTSAEFWTARFAQADGPLPSRLRVYWSWHAGEGWEAADQPRLAFAQLPVLYKLYVVAETSGAEPVDKNACVDFLRQVVPELEKTLARAW